MVFGLHILFFIRKSIVFKTHITGIVLRDKLVLEASFISSSHYLVKYLSHK